MPKTPPASSSTFVRFIAIFFLIFSAQTQAQTLTNLGAALGTNYSISHDVNDLGQVVGESGNGAYIYSNGSVSYLPHFSDGFGTSANGINNFGQVVGAGDRDGDNHAYLYSNGTLTDLGSFGGNRIDGANARAINDLGQVTGVTPTAPFGVHAFVYSSGTLTDISPASAYNAGGTGINLFGQVSGYIQPLGGDAQAFLYANGTTTMLGTLGGSYSVANSLNNFGQVTGISATADGKTHAFLYYNGLMTDLGTLGGQTSYANDINAFGQVVGYGDVGGTYHAFLYFGGSMHDLNTDYASLLSTDGIAPGFVQLATASAISDTGFITGQGLYFDGVSYTNQAYLLNIYDGIFDGDHAPGGHNAPDSAHSLLLVAGAFYSISLLRRKIR